MLIRFMLLGCLFLWPVAGHAKERVTPTSNGAMPVAGCEMQKTASISLTVEEANPTVKGVRDSFEERIKQAKDYAKQAGVNKMDFQSENYSINPLNNSGTSGVYQLTGNVTFEVSPLEKSYDLVELLTKNKIQSSLNVNMYKPEPCQ